MGYDKEEKETYFQIQPYSEKSKKYNLKTKLRMEFVNFNLKKYTQSGAAHRWATVNFYF